MFFKDEYIPLIDEDKQNHFISRVRKAIIECDFYNKHPERIERVISLIMPDFEENKFKQGKDGMTFLDFAVFQKQEYIAYRLITLGMKFNHSGPAQNPRFYTRTNEHANALLGMAIYRGRADVVKLLLSQGVDPNTTKIDMCDSPLDAAIIYGRYETVEALLNDPRTNFLDRACGIGFPPIVRAYERGEIKMVKLLLSRGAKLPEDYQTEYLLKYPEPAVEGNASASLPLQEIKPSSSESSANAGESFFDFSAHIDKQHLLTALSQSQTQSLNAASEGKFGLFLASLQSSLFYSEALKRKNKAITTPQNEALMEAIYKNSIPGIEAALAAGADVNYSNIYGRTPLINAACDDNGLTMVALLLSKGASVDAIDFEDCSALHHAVFKGNLPMTEQLLQAGSAKFINHHYGYGLTPLILAKNKGQENLVALLQSYSLPTNGLQARF